VCLFGCSVQENVKALLVKMNVYKILDWKPEAKVRLERLRCRWENCIKCAIRKWECLRIQLAQSRVECWPIMKVVMNPWALYTVGNTWLVPDPWIGLAVWGPTVRRDTDIITVVLWAVTVVLMSPEDICYEAFTATFCA
jgi:hypothetical protein